MDEKDINTQKEAFLRELKFAENAKNTIRAYRTCVEKYIAFLGDKELDKESILAYKELLLDKGYSKSYINKNIAAINRFVCFLGKEDLVVKRMKSQTKQIIENVPTEADYNRLLRMSKKMNQPDTYLIIKTIANTGVRVSELSFFTIENLGRSIEITNKGKTRIVPIRQELLREIKKHCRENRIKEGSIFPGEKEGAMLHPSTIWRRIQKVGRKAKLNADKLHPHALRHYFAKRYLEIPGNTVLDLSDLLGHAKVDTTAIYNRGTIEEARKKIEGMKY